MLTARVSDARLASAVPNSVEQLHPRPCRGGPGTAWDLTNGRASLMAKEGPARASRALSTALSWEQAPAFHVC